VADPNELATGIAAGWMRRRRQGAQPVRAGQERGDPRRDKFHLDVRAATPWLVSDDVWLRAG
jgi:hypothetical protein